MSCVNVLFLHTLACSSIIACCRSAPFQKGDEWEYPGAVALNETGTLTITITDAESVAASKVMTAMQTAIKQYVIVQKAVLEKHELQRDVFATSDAEAWYETIQQGAA